MKKILFTLLFLMVGIGYTSAQQSEPIVSITFDDTRDSIIPNALPIMDKYGMTATMYVTTGMVGEYGHMTYSDIRTLIDSDWEIGAHSIYHEDLTKLSPDSVYKNLIEPIWHLQRKFHIKVKSFASPYGAYNDSLIESVRPYYESHVNAWSDKKGLNELNDVNPYNVHRIDVTGDVSSKFVCNTIDSLKNGEWYVLLFHNVVEDVQGNWDTSVTKFEEIIKCASKVETKKISEVIN